LAPLGTHDVIQIPISRSTGGPAGPARLAFKEKGYFTKDLAIKVKIYPRRRGIAARRISWVRSDQASSSDCPQSKGS